MEQLLTIIIPYKNAGGTISRLLQSIESDAQNTVVFIVDDNSDAKNVEILSSLVHSLSDSSRNNHYQVLFNTGKYGGGARNTGIRQLRTTWVMFADADDYLCDSRHRPSGKQASRISEAGRDALFTLEQIQRR